MRQATEVYAREFDPVFFELPPHIWELIECKIREMGQRQEPHPRHRIQGRSEFRLRSADYRNIYEFDIQKNKLLLITLGHRREVYRH